jgi:peptidoglycan hydrolase CwlO-like protein
MQIRKITGSLIAITAVAVLCVGTVGAAGKGSNPNGKPFIELSGQIIEVEGEISSLQDQIDSLIGRVDSVEGEVDALGTAITDLEAQNVTLAAQITANTGDVLSLEAQIVVLHDANSDLQAQIDSNGDYDGALQGQIDSNDAEITVLATSIDTMQHSLQTSIDNNADLIAIMKDNIVALQTQIDMKQNVINGLCPDGSAIQEVLSGGSVVCESVSGGGAGTTYRVSKYVRAKAGRNYRVHASCRAGDTPISVQWRNEFGGAYATDVGNNPGGSVYAEMRNTIGYAKNIYVYATCMRN